MAEAHRIPTAPVGGTGRPVGRTSRTTPLRPHTATSPSRHPAEGQGGSRLRRVGSAGGATKTTTPALPLSSVPLATTQRAATLIQRWYRGLRNRRDQARRSRMRSVPSRVTHERHTTTDRISEKERSLPMPFRQSETAPQRQESPRKLSTIFTFLDQIDGAAPRVDSSRIVEKKQEMEGDAMARVVVLTLELEEKTKTINMLRSALEKRKKQEEEHLILLEEEQRTKVAAVKQALEAKLTRNLSFLDQVLVDKDALSRKCEELTAEVRSVEKRYEEKVQSLQDLHKKELERQRNAMERAEKVKRDKWAKDKLQELREMTIRGLEPEMDVLQTRHKADMRRLVDEYEERLRCQRSETQRECERAMEYLKERLLRERDEDIAKERELAQQRLDDQRRHILESMEAQRSKLEAEFSAERIRWETKASDERRAQDDRIRIIAREAHERLDTTKAEHKAAMADLVACHEAELERVRKEMQDVQAQTIAQTTRRLQADSVKREEGLRAQLLRERDEDLDHVIHRLSDETAQLQRSLETEMEKNIMARTSELEAMARNAKKSENEWKTKYFEMAEELRGKESELASGIRRAEQLQQDVDNKACQLEALAHDNTTLRRDVKEMKETMEEKLLVKKQEGEQENAQLRHTLRSMKEELVRKTKEFEKELEILRHRQYVELEQVDQRVRQTVARKDETIESLRTQLSEAQLRADHAVVLLEKQRRDFVL